MSTTIIIGASHAGVQAAASLRQAGLQDRIVLLSAEVDYPYHRPPLSKTYLSDEKSEDQILLRAPSFYSDQRIELRLDEPALSIDAHARNVATGKDRLSYDRLILATGSRARPLALPGADAAGIYTLRTLSDARGLREAVRNASQVVIVGGGFIGLEFASTAIKQGKSVTVIEAQNRLLSRSLPAALANFIQDHHVAAGVRFRFGDQIETFETKAGKVTGLRLAGGEVLPADLVLVGVGGIADTALVQSLGLETVAGGIKVDAHGLTSRPDIYALGDVAAFQNVCSSVPMRLESVQNAVDQAKSAAAHITGGQLPLVATPWFWTDQYDLKIQMAGLPQDGATEIIRGDPQSGAFSILQVKDDRLVATHSVNRAADHMASRRLIAEKTPLDLAKVKDIETPLLKALTAPPDESRSSR